MFRIDRKNVTVLPNKTCLFNGSQSEDPQDCPVEGESDGVTEETRAMVAELMKDAKHKAEQIIRDSQAKADDIEQQAQKKAEAERQELLKQAQKEAEELKEYARRDGYMLGQTQAEEEAQSRKEQEEQQYQTLIDNANDQRDAMLGELEGGIHSLIMEIVRKVIRIKLEQSDRVFQGIVKEMIADFYTADDLTIRISPEDYTAYFGPDWKPEGRRPDDGRITLLPDEDYHQGDCTIESSTAMIDCGIEHQLGVIEKALNNG